MEQRPRSATGKSGSGSGIWRWLRVDVDSGEIAEAAPRSNGRRAWPAVPKPLPGEAFGGWLGRVTARYGVTVSELVDASGTEIDLGSNALTRLAAAPPVGAQALLLSATTGVKVEVFKEMADAAPPVPQSFPYCFHCLVANSLDAAAPCWQLAWLSADWPGCEQRPLERDVLSRSDLRDRGNMKRLMHYVSVRHRDRVAIWGPRIR
jgi:hypothetical protein